MHFVEMYNFFFLLLLPLPQYKNVCLLNGGKMHIYRWHINLFNWLWLFVIRFICKRWQHYCKGKKYNVTFLSWSLTYSSVSNWRWVGWLLGWLQPLCLTLLDIAPMMGVLEGVVMELNDCAFPLLRGQLVFCFVFLACW